jgi:folate-dependent phosphoribosylglycinamide formyltransferase PurN
MFGSGPALTSDVKEFICTLEDHPDIVLMAAFCQAEAQSLRAIAKDLWQRRGVLAFPLLIVWLVQSIAPYITQPTSTMALRRKMRKLSHKIHFVEDIHARDVVSRVSLLSPDLGLIYGSPILEPKLFEIPALGTLGIHHGKLPEYRGNKTLFWAMQNGEKKAGVTIQKINAGLDTGQVVREGEVFIGNRSQSAVWRDLEKLGLDLYMQAILEIKEGTANYQSPRGSKGKLYRNPKIGDYLRFWGRRLKRRIGKVIVDD